jgi:alpha-D-xyloside xylohydrolase
MKLKLVFFITLIPALAFAQVYKKHNLVKDHLSIQLSEGVLNITPLSDKAIRVQWEKGMKE